MKVVMNDIMLQIAPVDSGLIWTVISGSIIGIISFLVSRSITEQDKKIDDIEQKVDKIKDDLEKLREKMRDSNESMNNNIRDLKEVVLKDIGSVLLKIAEIKRNDAK